MAEEQTPETIAHGYVRVDHYGEPTITPGEVLRNGEVWFHADSGAKPIRVTNPSDVVGDPDVLRAGRAS